MANNLSDDDLRKSLQEYGEDDVGPITPTTRSLWEKRLTNLRKISPGPLYNRRSLNAFSSDDSEIESNAVSSSRARKKRTLNRNDTSDTRLSLNRSNSTSPPSLDSDIFKKPSPVHIPILGQQKTYGKNLLLRSQQSKVKARRSVGRPTAYDVETSDSDFDADHGSKSSLRLRRKSSTSSNPTSPSDLLGVSLKRQSSDNTSLENSLHRKSLGLTSWNANHKPLYHYSPILSKSKQGIRLNFILCNM